MSVQYRARRSLVGKAGGRCTPGSWRCGGVSQFPHRFRNIGTGGAVGGGLDQEGAFGGLLRAALSEPRGSRR
jgi:hypothetical protein